MGLDKWLKPEEEGKKPNRKDTASAKEKRSPDEKSINVDPKKVYSTLTKYKLTCTNSKCKYQKTIMKKQLTEMDKICPRCRNEMKNK